MGAISRGIVAVVLTGVLIVAAENARGGIVKRALSLRPVTYLGRVSYGTYLWHWPIVVIATHHRHVSQPVLFVLTSALATALAAVSFHGLERPIRSSPRLNRYRVPVVVAGLAISVIGGLVLAPAILEPGDSLTVRVGTGAAAHRIDLRASLARAPLPDCLGKPITGCTVIHGTGLRVVLMGDSHARMWTPAFAAIAKRESWQLSVVALNECPWQRGLRYAQSNPNIRANCRRHQNDWYNREIPQLKPDIIFLAHQAFDEFRFRSLLVLPDGDVGRTRIPRIRRKVTEVTKSSIHALESFARKVVVIEPIGLAPFLFDPLDCLSNGGPPAKCEYRMQALPTPQEVLYRHLADQRRAWSLNLDRLVCPRDPICDPIIRGLIVKRDGGHLTIKFARSLAPLIAAELRRIGVLTQR
jgi:hypothetical protein